MQNSKESWLIEYLLNSKFLFNPADLEEKISGMTATQIINAMEAAKTLQTDLNNTPLGRELL